jgi:endonuclease/exonuclease/phosphatase family metal-dependent hydrolase
VRLVSYNVEGLRQGAQVARVVRGLEADVVALQEPGRGPLGLVRLAVLARRTGLRRVARCGTTALLVAGHVEVAPAVGVVRAGLVNALNRFGRTNRFTHRQPPSGVQLPRGRPTWRRPHPMGRGASLREVDGIGVVVLHLPPDDQQRRLEHLERIADRWEHRDPQLVVGDLNERPGGPVWLRLTGTLHDLAPDVGPTYPTPRPRIRIDAVLGSASLRTVRAWVPDDATVLAASDHRPVVVELERIA